MDERGDGAPDSRYRRPSTGGHQERREWTAPASSPPPSLPPVGGEPPPAPPVYAWDGGPPPARRPRWLLPAIALVAVVLVAAIVIAAVLALDVLRLAPPSAVTDQARAGYGYLPDNSVFAVELRLDLPDDQREEFLRFVSRFPGFTDAGQVEQRMDDLLNEAVANISNGMANYDDDVEPWFEGWIVGGAAMPEEGTFEGPGTGVAVIGSRDRAAAELAMERLRPRGEWQPGEGPAGVTIWTGRDREWDEDIGAYTVTDDAVVFGSDAESVHTALAIKAGNQPSLLDAPRFNDATAGQPAGRLGMFWVDAEALEGYLQDAPFGGGMGMGSPFSMGLGCESYPSPLSVVGTMYMRDGRAIVDMAAEMPEGASTPAVRDSGLADRMPADTFLFLDSRDVGATVGDVLDCLRDSPMARQLQDIEDAMGQRVDDLVGWVGDAAVGVRYDGARAGAGLVLRVTDQVKASEAMGQLRALLTALGSEGSGTEVNVSEEDYNGVRVVTFEFGGPMVEVGPPPAPVPSLAYAFDDDLLIIGVDASFARAVIDAGETNSLAASDGYRRGLDAAGGEVNGGAFYLDMATTMQLVEAAATELAGGGLEEQLRDVRAVADEIESIVTVSSVDGQTVTTRFVLSTREE